MNRSPSIPALSPSSSRREFVGQLAAGAAALALVPAAALAADAAPAAVPGRGRGRGGPPPPPLSSKKLGIALVGLGSYANTLASALARTQHCSLTGVATRDPEGNGTLGEWEEQLWEGQEMNGRFLNMLPPVN
jgi:hypothetical protein